MSSAEKSSQAWKKLRPEFQGRHLVFKTRRYFSFPYSLAQRLEIFRLVSIKSFINYPDKWSSTVGFVKTPYINKTGSAAPDFTLPDTEDKLYTLSEFKGVNVVFMFVAMTCPPARIQTEAWNQLLEKYSGDDVQPLLIYSRERHPGDPGYLEFHHPENHQEKLRYARMHAELTRFPVLVDTFDQQVLSLYGKVPNQSVIVNRSGLIVFKSGWACVEQIELVLDTILDNETSDA